LVVLTKSCRGNQQRKHSHRQTKSNMHATVV
jgi:hypothetical protein